MYRLKFVLTYREIRPQEHVERLEMIAKNIVDVAWDQQEYQIAAALGPNSTHVRVRPQKHLQEFLI